jgi:hypothetical protein
MKEKQGNYNLESCHDNKKKYARAGAIIASRKGLNTMGLLMLLYVKFIWYA